jgi:glutaminase
MKCTHLVKATLPFAGNGQGMNVTLIMEGKDMRIMNSLTNLCRIYNESPSMAAGLGVAVKRGSVGGTVAIDPGRFCLAIWSPPINKSGNSVAGLEAFRLIIEKMDEMKMRENHV